jgi:hypothetical protein
MDYQWKVISGINTKRKKRSRPIYKILRIMTYLDEVLETPKTDKVVDDVINQFKERSKRGIEKYGTTLQENNTDDFLQHFKEELMDAILYIQKLQSQKNEN